VTAGLLPQPELASIDACIARIEAGEPASFALDAAVMAARGFEVMGRFSSTARASCRHRGALAKPMAPEVRGGAPWQRIPRLSIDPLAAGAVIPWGWHWGMAMRGAPSGEAAYPFEARSACTAWCQDPRQPLRYCEGYARNLALAVLKVGLYAVRLELLEAAQRSLAPPCPPIDAARVGCACGWEGPADAWRHGGCPDCGRRVTHGAPLLIAEGGR